MVQLVGLVPSWAPTARVWQAPGLVARAGEVARAAGLSRLLLVTDPGVAALPLFGALRDALGPLAAGVFDDVEADPPIATVERALLLAQSLRPDGVVSLGGGSAIDTAKALAACLAEGRAAATLAEAPPARALPHIAIPTTAGTGAEASNSAILTDDAGRKRAVIAECLPPAFVLLDPDALLGQPRALLAACGLDALSHGLESLVSRQAGAPSRMLSRECIRLVSRALPPLLAGQDDERARAELQLGAHLGGAALRLARLGYAHALAHAVAEHRKAPHGVLVAEALPAVLRFNAPAAGALYEEAARLAGHRSMEALLASLMEAAGVAPGYARHALSPAERDAIVARCGAGPFHQWNPRRAEAVDFHALLAA